jgi:hypothetical protein
MKLDIEVAGAAAGAVRETHEETWLLGQAPMRKYLDFVSDIGIEPLLPKRPRLVEEWGRAAQYYDELAEREAGIADHADQLPLDPALAPLAAQVMASPRFGATFDSLPTRIVMVEVAKLVVCQNHVTRTFVEGLKARLGPDPDPAALLRFCLPLDDGRTPVQVRETGSRRFTFTSGSTDLRYHESMLLKPHQLPAYTSFGEVAGVVGVEVGFSSNFMNAVCDDDSGRLLLHNGYHRACALVELGITHAPCVVQTVSSRDELDLVAKSVVAQDPGYFFNAPRPPLLKDFADPRIRRVIPVKKVSRVIEVSWEVRDYFVED